MYKPDPLIARKILSKVANYFDSSYEDAKGALRCLTIQKMEECGMDEDENDRAEYHVLMDIADDSNDPELAYLTHLYRVGYFQEDTENYIPRQGEEYETVNANYLYGIEFTNVRKIRVA